jgi:hypothetical protein
MTNDLQHARFFPPCHWLDLSAPLQLSSAAVAAQPFIAILATVRVTPTARLQLLPK